MNLDYASINTAMVMFSLLWSAGLTAIVFLRKPGIDAGRAVDVLRADVDLKFAAQERRLTQIETHLKHMPSKEDLQMISGKVDVITERVFATVENQQAIKVTLARIETYLLQHMRD